VTARPRRIRRPRCCAVPVGPTKVFVDLNCRYALLPDGYKQMIEQLMRLRDVRVVAR
jgi:hypothetical protein